MIARGCLLAMLCCCALACTGSVVQAQGYPEGAKVLLVDSQHCTSLPELARWLNAAVTALPDEAAVRITRGKQYLQVQSGTILASSDSGLLLLPTCPTRVNGVWYVPTGAVVAQFGGTATPGAAGMQLQFQGQAVQLPPATVLPAGTGFAGRSLTWPIRACPWKMCSDRTGNQHAAQGRRRLQRRRQAGRTGLARAVQRIKGAQAAGLPAAGGWGDRAGAERRRRTR